MAEAVRGYLCISIEEASGKSQRDQFTWDTNAGPFEAFVKVEIRGGSRNIKAQTRKAPLVGVNVTWREELRMELLEGSSELRLMLCREKFQGTKKGTSVVAACGIYVNDILEAVPIDKYFELFKPNAGGEGGFIRIRMNFVRSLAELDQPQRPEGNLQPNVAFAQQPTSTRDVAGRLQGVVSPDTVEEVARRVANLGTEPEAPAAAKEAGKGRKKRALVAAGVVVVGVGLSLLLRGRRGGKERKEGKRSK